MSTLHHSVRRPASLGPRQSPRRARRPLLAIALLVLVACPLAEAATRTSDDEAATPGVTGVQETLVVRLPAGVAGPVAARVLEGIDQTGGAVVPGATADRLLGDALAAGGVLVAAARTPRPDARIPVHTDRLAGEGWIVSVEHRPAPDDDAPPGLVVEAVLRSPESVPPRRAALTVLVDRHPELDAAHVRIGRLESPGAGEQSWTPVADAILITRGVPAAGLPAPLDRVDPSALYGRRPPSRDGIGKVYLGREISFVMGHLAAGWLERPEREQEERTDLLLSALPLRPDSVVADIGAGTGYFSIPIARRAPEGRVLAVDIQPQMLELLREQSRMSGVTNVEPVLGRVDDPRLPVASVDVAIMIDAYHEFDHPWEMMRALRKAMKPDGRVVLVEYRAEDPTVPIKPLHKMSVDQVRREMTAAGFVLDRVDARLPRQHILLFRPRRLGLDRQERSARRRRPRRRACRRATSSPRRASSTGRG